MATGFPVKANYATGDVLTAANMNDLAGTLNYLDPTAKGDLFPASDGSTLTRLAVGSNGQVLTADSTAATGMKWAAAGGKVLQVVQGTVTATASNSTTTPADTGLTATITPSATTSKILVLVNQQGCYKSGANSQNAINLKLLRGSTTIQQIATNLFYNTTVGEVSGSVSAAYLDSPSTTSATTYKTQFYNYASAASVSVQIQNVDVSSIILIEIGA